MKNILILSILLSNCCYAQTGNSNTSGVYKDWQTGLFVKPATNPIMQADSSYLFSCPLKKEQVQWQKTVFFILRYGG